MVTRGKLGRDGIHSSYDCGENVCKKKKKDLPGGRKRKFRAKTSVRQEGDNLLQSR